ncbi:transglycosylase SLT domain-containing protein [Candidatus Halobeggiatoa sp. HSG11]|nr:transglycosylase SLT domain-containing protein [Candidatus Halobeggiatoa sp. HSG11]
MKIVLLFCVIFTNLVQAADVEQRWQFLAANRALSNNDLKKFEQKLTELQDYPIAHYLRYFYLTSRLTTKYNQDILAFLERYPTSPASKSLRHKWLHKLAQRRDDKMFLIAYTPQEEAALRCYFLKANLNMKKNLKNLERKAKDLWLVGKSQHSFCNSSFKYLYKNKLISFKLRWKRVRLAMQEGELQLARKLAKNLPKTDRLLLKRWQNIHKKPASGLKNFKYPDTALAREIIVYGLKRLAHQDADKAYDYWKNNFKRHYAFRSKTNEKLLYHFALEGIKQHLSVAMVWLTEIGKNDDQQINHQRLQIALYKQDWRMVKKIVHSLTNELQQQTQWQYWLARALEETGHNYEAEAIFQKLIKFRNYYGFLAADRLGKDYNFQSQQLQITSKSEEQLLVKEPGLIRARELYFLGQTALARAEWQDVLPTLTPNELKVTAMLAHKWGWYDRSTTIAGDDLDIGFPLPFYDIIMSQSQVQYIEFSRVYAIILAESKFQTDAHSADGRLGLMQLKLKEAKNMAVKQNVSLNNIEELFLPDINIALGTAYLRQLLNEFDNDQLLAFAAYNAGIETVKYWLKKYSCLPADIWIELIPARDYVQQILSYIPIFAHQMGNKQQMPLDTISTDKCS